MRSPDANALYSALRDLKNHLIALTKALGMDSRDAVDRWVAAVDAKLLPRLLPDSPVLVAICGGGSAGKSTLFNTLAGARLSPAGGKAGINRRTLVGVPESRAADSEILSELFRPLGPEPRLLQAPVELVEPGPPLYVINDTVPSNLVLMDTPDVDTGAGGEYTNRDAARKALEASDVLIYIFTNSTYHNRDNTDFIARMLTGIGRRPCFLVYRVDPTFSDDEVIDHADTVARNLYGGDAGRHVLGVYRADEDNAVAAGERFMEMRPVRRPDAPLADALAAIDPRETRLAILDSILADALAEAGRIVERAGQSKIALQLYSDALQTGQSHCVQDALSHFPLDRAVKRFAEIWLETDPWPVKAMRKTGSVLEIPFNTLTTAVRWTRKRLAGKPEKKTSTDAMVRVEADLLGALNRLYAMATAEEIAIPLVESDPAARRMIRAARQLAGGTDPLSFRIALKSEGGGAVSLSMAAHPAVRSRRQDLRDGDWSFIASSILSHREQILSLSADVESELKALAARYRSRMNLWDEMRQAVSAFLNILPATAAVTYVLSTGDPAGAAGIKVKLSGLFGLQDLYALVAIPATSGMKRADQKQLETLLAPIARTWLDSKLEVVRELFEREISGGIIRAADEALRAADERIEGIKQALNQCRQAGRS